MTDKWTDERLSDVLDVDYHHLVFTVPWQLRSITLANPKVMLGLMFRSVSISLQSWTKKYGGYTPGIYCIVHTFGSDLKYHPHFHVLITAGGLSLDKNQWIDSPGDYLLPEKGLKKRFRYQVVKQIIKANDKLLSLTRKALNQKEPIKFIHSSWRKRTKNRERKDPLVCKVCNIEMVLVFVCFTYQYDMNKKLGLKPDEVIPSGQIKIDTS